MSKSGHIFLEGENEKHDGTLQGRIDIHLFSDDSAEFIADNGENLVTVLLDSRQISKLRELLGVISVPVIGVLDGKTRIEFPGSKS